MLFRMLRGGRASAFSPGVIAPTLLLATAPVGAAPFEAGSVQEHALANGMKVILCPDPSIPNLAIYTFWRVGSRNEAPGITGLAHFFEHMMFNGSRNVPPGEFDRRMEAAGGSNNAYTSNDVTVYQDWVPASALDLTLDLERDRIGWLSVDPKLVESERGVVMSERRRTVEDDNYNLMHEQLHAAAFMAHPYQWPVIGWRSDIQSWRQEDVEAFHRSWYAPNNATLVLVGAFDPGKALALLQQKLGSIPGRELPRGVVTVEPEQHGERRVELRKQAGLWSVLAGFHVSATVEADTRVLELIDLILAKGESSRLYRRLVDHDQLALEVDCELGLNFDPGLYTILVEGREGVQGTPMEAALYQELARLGSEAVSDRELRKAKNIRLAHFYEGIATISGKAEALGVYELFHGGWRSLFGAAAEYESVTAADVLRVARAYLRPENRTVVTLIPTDPAKGAEDAR